MLNNCMYFCSVHCFLLADVLRVWSRKPQGMQLDPFFSSSLSQPTGLVWVLLLEVSQIVTFVLSSGLSSCFLPCCFQQSFIPQVSYQPASISLLGGTRAEGTFPTHPYHQHPTSELRLRWYAVNLNSSDILLSGDTWKKKKKLQLRV